MVVSGEPGSGHQQMKMLWRLYGDHVEIIKNGLLRIEYSLLGCLLVDTVKRRGDTEKISGPEKAFSALGGHGVLCYDSNILAATDSKRRSARRQEICHRGVW